MRETNRSYSNRPAISRIQLILLLIAVVFLGIVLYRLNSGKTLNLNNKAAEAVDLDKDIAERVKVFGYSEQSSNGARYKLRIETPPTFAFQPKNFVLEPGTKDIPVSNTSMAYPCNAVTEGDFGSGYETDWFTEGIGDSLDAQYKVIFADENGKLYTSSYQLSHMCSVLSPDAVKPVEGPIENDLPSE